MTTPSTDTLLSSALTLPTHIANLTCVRTGKAMPFTREQTSAINKAPIKSAVAVNFMGLVTDEQADRKHHGGPLKAVHQMGTATYATLNQHFNLKTSIGLLGENLTTQPVGNYPNMEESNVCIGDVYHYGDINAADTSNHVRLLVVQPRRPCYKINDQIGQLGKLPNIASWMTKQGISGWYFKVIQDGVIDTDLPVYLVERPYPFATLQKLWALANAKGKLEADVIEPWLGIDCLEDSWKKVLSKNFVKK